MTTVRNAIGIGRRRTIILGLATLAAVAILTALLVPAFAHPEASLPGSIFEIEDPSVDPGANLKVDDNTAPVTDPPDSLDWANVEQDRKPDAPTGQNDDSFGQGSKEDTPAPTVVAGSIPPNKSDLTEFGIYQERTGGKNFLHMYWSRVQDPSGTTNMDFEFNRSSTKSANGITPVRSQDDMLIMYDLSKGGRVPTIWVSFWQATDTGVPCEASNSYPCWGARVDLSAQGKATGSINNVTIPATDADGLGSKSPRTFGEASLALDEIFPPGTCSSFGSVYLKSRSSDSFTSALKDFIPPITKTISNCGKLTIKKVTVPSSDAQDFMFSTSAATESGTVGTFYLDTDSTDNTLADTKEISGVLAGTGITITESSQTGWVLTGISCDQQGATYTGSGGAGDTGSFQPGDNIATIDISVGADVTCTFTNKKLSSIVIEKKTVGGTGTFNFTDGGLTTSPVSDDPDIDFQLTTTVAGDAGVASKTFGSLAAGTYTFDEDIPAGWSLSSLSCDNETTGNTTTGALSVTLDWGETITCRYVNNKLGSIVIEKKTVGGTGTFNFTDGGLTTSPVSDDPDIDFQLTTTVAGDAGVVSKTFGSLAAGTYTFDEDIPAGWSLSSLSCDDETTGNTTTGALSVTLDWGETITCRYVNTGQGSIKIVKATVGGNGTFPFTESGLPGSGFSLTTGGTPGAEETTFSGLTTGLVYTVTETDPGSAWRLTNVSCSGDTNSIIGINGETDDSDFDAGDDTVSITLAAGENITCTFTNTKLGRLDIVKTDDLGNAMAGVTFTLHGVVDNEGTLEPGDAIDVALPLGTADFTCTTAGEPATCSIENIPLGQYFIVETGIPDGYSTDGLLPQLITVTAGYDSDFAFENPNLHKVVVMVCHMGTGDIAGGTFGPSGEGDAYSTIAESAFEGLGLDADEIDAVIGALCGLPGVDDLPHGAIPVDVVVGEHPS